jgi:hypothetical protein
MYSIYVNNTYISNDYERFFQLLHIYCTKLVLTNY